MIYVVNGVPCFNPHQVSYSGTFSHHVMNDASCDKFNASSSAINAFRQEYKMPEERVLYYKRGLSEPGKRAALERPIKQSESHVKKVSNQIYSS